MRITKIGSDFIRIDEENLYDKSLRNIPKVHIIKLDFSEPTIEKVELVLKDFKSTNRFAIEDNIRFYNEILKKTNKKYYIYNKRNAGLISFYKKNNKVLLDTTRLTSEEKSFVFGLSLNDVLNNTEVMIVSLFDYRDNAKKFNKWNGNLIIV